MLFRFSAVLLLSLTALTMNPCSVSAQYSTGDDGVMASGTETIQVKPQKLQLILQAKAEGKDAKSAIVSLAEHRLRVKKELIAMKADESSITFSATSLGGDDANASRQAAMQMQMMRRNNSSSANADAMPKTFTATCTVKAVWPLPIQEGDALALLPASLQEQIEARDLVGNNNKPVMDAAAKEKMEEMKAMMEEQYSYYDSEQNGSGPKILFMAEISDDKMQAATKAAFDKATKTATSLAAATGSKLGKLVSLRSSDTSVNNQYARMYMSAYSGQSGMTEDMMPEGENIVIATSPDQLSKSIAIAVVYKIAE